MDKLRGWIGALGWRLFIGCYAGTEEDYFEEIYWQERQRREKPLAAGSDPEVAP